MSLEFILGAAGSGKSTYAYEKLISESLKDPEGSFIVLVPEQFTMQTQRQLVKMHPKKGILNIDVLSFPRLAHRVFQETGAAGVSVLSETGKNLILRRAAGLAADRLTLLGSRMERQGYIEQVKSILSEFAQYEITDQELSSMIEDCEGKPSLQTKLKDIRVLSEVFEEFKKDRFITGEEMLGVFARELPSSRVMKDAVLVLDGFTGFTPVQMTALESMLQAAKKISIVLTIPGEENIYGRLQEQDLFYLSKKTIQAVEKMAASGNVPILDHILARGSRFAEGSGLAYLEKHLMRFEKRAPLEKQKETGEMEAEKIQAEDIFLSCAPDPSREIFQTAGEISRLVREEGYRYREIAVIASDLSSYAHYAGRIFDDFQIPYFIDHKIRVGLNPCLELIRALFETADKGFRYDGVMRILRTGYVTDKTEQIDVLDNYLLAAGIRGRKQWENTWEYLPRGFDQETLDMLNNLRVELLSLLTPAVDTLGKASCTVAEYTRAVGNALATFRIQEKLDEDRLRFEDTENTPMLLPALDRQARAMEYDQIYGVVMQVLEEAETLLGSEKVSRKEYMKILEAGFSDARVGLIPPSLEQVYVGDLERTRLSGIRALFFVGLNDGQIPSRKEKTGLLTAYEREYLEEHDYVLAPGLRRSIYTQRFYLYQMLAKPSDRLYLSYAQSDMSGNPLRPSYLVTSIGQLVTVKPFSSEKPVTLLSSGTGLLELAGRIREAAVTGLMPDRLKELACAYLSDGKYKERAERLFCEAESVIGKERLSEDRAKTLYGSELYGSVSRIDSFAQCPFSHFAQYGLRLRERDEHRIQPTDTGTILHEALRAFFTRIRDENTWKDISPSAQRQLAEECIKQAAEQYGGSLFDDTARNRYSFERASDIMLTAVQMLMIQLQAGSFAPEGLELSFDTGDDKSGGDFRLVGQIDRLDTASADGKRYVKIIDYKSGSTSFDLNAIYDGRQLQLPVYLHQALAMEEKNNPDGQVVPAGLFYCHLDDPLISISPAAAANPDKAEEEAQKQMLKALKPDGLTSSDPDVLALYAQDEGVRKEVVNVPQYTPEGTMKETSRAASESQLRDLDRYVQDKMREFSARIMEGDIALHPYKDKARAVCEYCDYRSVCGFEERREGAAYRLKSDLTRTQLWAKIKQELQDESEEAVD